MILKTQFFKIVLKKAFTVEIFHKFVLGKSLLKFFLLIKFKNIYRLT